MAATEAQVREAYRRHFAETREFAEAHNRTLNELAGAYDPDAPESAHQERLRIADIIRDVSDEIELALGDPFQLALRDAMRSLRRDGVTAAAKDAWRDVVDAARDELEMKPYREVRHPPPGPKEWKPGMKRGPRIERRKRRLEDILEHYEGPYLYVMFDDHGRLEGWTIDRPDYFRGHGGPVASVPVSDRLTYTDIRREIADTLSQADIDWEGGE